MKLLILSALFALGSVTACEKSVVLYSRADCGPCRKLKKTLEEMGVKYEEGDLSRTDVTEVPTIIVVCGGKETKIVGNKTKEELEALLK